MATMPRRRLILASRSKGRAILLRSWHIHFEQIDPPFADPPQPPDGDPEQVAMMLARQKLASLTEPPPADAVVLTADTLVLMPDGSLAGTPTSRDEARTMISAMLNQRHAIITGVAMQAGDAEPTCLADRAEVYVGQVNDDQLEAYIQSDQWQGKAGGYNLFDRRDAGWPVQVEGDEATVVGLPADKLMPHLRRLGVIDPSYEQRSALIPHMVAWPYQVAVSIRNWLFDKGLRKQTRLPRPAIAVGNLTTGGTGKTPMVIEIARRLLDLDQRPAVLLRGYKAANGRSDEAMVYRDELGSSVEVEADPNRVAGANAVIARNGDVTCFLLDDAFQHRQVLRRLNIVLIDATHPFGFGALLPMGRLREPVNNLQRADAVIVTRCDQVRDQDVEAIDRRIKQVTGRKPVAHAAHRWTQFVDGHCQTHPLTHLADRRVLGVCGIGNSDAFFDSLYVHVARAEPLRRADHHHWQASEIRDAVAAHHPDAIVTTNKDWVKIRDLDLRLDIPIYRPTLKIAFLDGEDAVNAMLRGFVSGDGADH
jgi:tetraacyldisaccharide 4'-kinase